MIPSKRCQTVFTIHITSHKPDSPVYAIDMSHSSYTLLAKSTPSVYIPLKLVWMGITVSVQILIRCLFDRNGICLLEGDSQVVRHNLRLDRVVASRKEPRLREGLVVYVRFEAKSTDYRLKPYCTAVEKNVEGDASKISRCGCDGSLSRIFYVSSAS
jgi:hypothetical protein